MSKKTRARHTNGPSQQGLLALVRDAGGTGITAQQLLLKLGLDKRDREAVHAMLSDLIAKGKVENAPRGRFVAHGGRTDPGKQVGGTEATIDIIMSGAGYARLGPGKDDVYVPENAVGTALHGDKVLLRISSGRGRPEGKVLQVLERRRTRYVGKVENKGAQMLLNPDDQKMNRPLLIRPDGLNGAKVGEKVIAEMAPWTDAREMPCCSVVRILGKAGEHEVEIHAILAEFDLPAEFPAEVEEAAENIPSGISKEEIAKRRDVRKITTLTIDPDDAKDLDDALSVRKLENGNWEVGIHIADVSHYVQPGALVDKEAAARATSVYLVDRVVPMLPEHLSNNLCSLNPHTDKLSFSAIFEIDDKARLHGEWFGRTIMNSDRRFAYAEAQALIDGGQGEFKDEVLTLYELSKILRKERMDNGALEVGGNEVKFKLDEKGRPIEVYEKVMGPANWLIEEFMLLANKRVAAWVSSRKGGAPPFVYRIHDLPDPEKVQQLRVLAKSFGHNLKTDGRPEDLPKAINQLMRAIKGTEEENILKQVTIRSMSKAIYSTENIGHYGLAFEDYTHFTSPIRRYPDLMVHRAMAHYLAGGKPLDVKKLDISCAHSSAMEKRAADAERASIKFKQAEYMLARVGQTFAGIVSGLTSWGMYVEVIENKCEGMITLRDLPGDHYKFEQEKYSVVGQRTGRRFSLGDDLQVMVRGVDMEKRVIDFSLVDEGPANTPPERSTRGQWDETRPYPAGGGGGAKKGFRSPKGTGAKKDRKSGGNSKGKGKKRR
ncbi:MAG: ribonuclease R [Flavobacteriales bacterium]|nr:ribonuclease R [Flavobacteriales bacterium]MBK6894641.1 ribonuclease R [Flavobacteriales bacterium]MBK9058342.1 ribonuclease R [Flavobacteriales bacterium]HQV40078.1 ribonuclease R [Flavobacteriales bacterium]HQW33538.1 ribonuclease R [Flavobacteriales bacterium]